MYDNMAITTPIADQTRAHTHCFKAFLSQLDVIKRYHQYTTTAVQTTLNAHHKYSLI
jgi:hypothetical protein